MKSAEPGPDGEDHVRLGGKRVGRRGAGDADGAGGLGMVPGERALAGLGLGHGDAVPLGEVGERLARQRVVHAAAGDDERRLGVRQHRGGVGELGRVGRRASEAPVP